MNGTQNSFFILLSFTLMLWTVSCNESTSEKQNNDSVEVQKPQPSNVIKLDSLHSLIKNKNVAAVLAYEIISADSFSIDIRDYNFSLSDPAFTYIRDNINYKEMVVSSPSFAYVRALSGDSTLYTTAEFRKSADNNTITVKIKDKRITDFKLAFRFYIDNGKGEQEIDAFKVKVAAK